MISSFDLFIFSMLVMCDKLALASFFSMMSGSNWQMPLLYTVLLRIISLEKCKNIACVLWRFPLLEEYLQEGLLLLCRPERLLQISLFFLKMHGIKLLCL